MAPQAPSAGIHLAPQHRLLSSQPASFQRARSPHTPPNLTLFVDKRHSRFAPEEPAVAPPDPVGIELDGLLGRYGVVVLRDLRGPDCAPNIDHLCIGPGGVTVIDAKSYGARVRGRRGELWVGKRKNTSLVEGVLDQVEFVREALESRDFTNVDVVGAICSRQRPGIRVRPGIVDGVRVDGMKALARLAQREPERVDLDVDAAAFALRRQLWPTHALQLGSENGNPLAIAG